MKFGSLFSGIGGFDLGLERAGLECRWQVEIDDYCRRVLAKHWPNVKRYADVKELTGHELEWVDVFVGGFPCPPVSLAGEHLGIFDPRWLWPEYIRLIRHLRPRFVLVENVPGLLSANDGRAMGEILGDLAGCGYDTEWQSLPAAAFGAPHIRERVFILANADCAERRPQSERRHEPNWHDAGWQEATGGLETRSQNGGTADVADTDGPRLPKRQGVRSDARPQLAATQRSGVPLHDADGTDGDEGRRPPQREGRYAIFSGGGVGAPGPSHHYDVEPGVGRMADGVPARVDRLRALGNAVVPQVAEWLGQRIMQTGGGG